MRCVALEAHAAVAACCWRLTTWGVEQCAFYFMNVAIDTTLGVYIAYLLLQLVTVLAVSCWVAATI